jgi:Putative Flp pilus-assembly TadE/G-like
MAPHAALKLARCRKGNFAVMFALMLPVLAAFMTFIFDQANIAHLQSRVREARDAATVAAAQEFVMGNKSHAQLEAYAKDFFLANLGEEYREASSVKLTTPKPPSQRGFSLEAHVKYQPLLAPVYAAASGQADGEYVVDLH